VADGANSGKYSVQHRQKSLLDMEKIAIFSDDGEKTLLTPEGMAET